MMDRRLAKAGIGLAMTVLVAGCAAAEDPRQEARRMLDEALVALSDEPHRADVEIDVHAFAYSMQPFEMTAEMRGTHRSMPERKATDLDLSSVTSTTERRNGDDLVRTGAVRVIMVDGGTHVRNTLESKRWRTLSKEPRITWKGGVEPTSTARMIQPTVLAEMFRSRARRHLVSSPSATATAGEQMSVYSITCTLADCLADAPEARETALGAYPGDALFNAELWVDRQARPRRLEMDGDFMFRAGNTGVQVKPKTTLVLHDLGEPQHITAPVG